jgi:hypothetical protein
VIRVFGTYALPIGPGRALDLRDPVLNRMLDRWVFSFRFETFSGSRNWLASGRTTFNSTMEGGVVRTISREQFESMLGKFGEGPSNNFYCVDTSLIGTDGRIKPELIGYPSTPGKVDEWFFFYGPWTWSFHAALNKEFRFTESTRLRLAAEANNVLNHPTFNWGGITSLGSTTFGQTTSVSGTRSMQLRLELVW